LGKGFLKIREGYVGITLGRNRGTRKNARVRKQFKTPNIWFKRHLFKEVISPRNAPKKTV